MGKVKVATNIDAKGNIKNDIEVNNAKTNTPTLALSDSSPKSNRFFNFFRNFFKSSVKTESVKNSNDSRSRELDANDTLLTKAAWVLFIELLESLFKKKLSTNEMTKALHENEQLSKEFIIKKLGKAINENSDLSTQQKALLNQKLNNRDFMQDFCDKLGIKDESTIQKAKSTKDLLTQLNKLGSINKEGKEKCEQIETRTNSQNPNSLDNTAFNSMIESVKGELTELLNQNQALSKLVHKIRKQG